MSLSPERRAALVASRAVALIRNHFDLQVDPADIREFANGGAAVVIDGFAFVDPATSNVGLGACLAWALRNDATELHVIAGDGDSGWLPIAARQAHLFDPAPTVWVVDGTRLVEVSPASLPPVLVPPPSTAEQVLLLEQAGVDVVIERGVVLGEVRGLEVAQVVVSDDGTADLQVGVGRFDREAFALLHGDLAPPDALGRVVAEISSIRSSDAEPHPINRLARERWLRHQLVNSPELVGATSLRPVESPRDRDGLRDIGVAMALGERPDGTQLVVGCSVGVDLDAVPGAADTRSWHAPDADLVIVVPPGDAHSATHAIAGHLRRPAEVLEIAGEWPR